jgi:hypothetical protein
LRIIHKVKCKYCGKIFDRDKVPFKQISAQRYAHYECAVAAENSKKQEDIDKEELENYIKQLLNEDFISPRVRKQINSFIEQYNYTYSGMRKALIYFYEVKGNDKSKANGGIGIIPYCYKQAYDYYYSLWLAKQKNEDKDITTYVPQTKVVKIPVPQRKIRKRKLFTFLDDDEV